MFKRQTTGSLICASCGVLVGVNDDTCYNCGRRNPGLWGYGPALRALGRDLGFAPFVIGLCIVIYVLTLIFSRGELTGGGLFSFGSPSGLALFVFGATGLDPVIGAGRWWTVLSAGWLHAGILHIFLNMMALRQLAPGIADLYGPGRMVIIYVLSSIAGFLASVYGPDFLILQKTPFTVGASAGISGLIGALLAYGHRSGSSMARAMAIQNIVMLLLMGFLFPAINNYAHFGGFAGGYLIAKTLDPLKPERIDHVAIAVFLLALSILSVVYSFVDGIQLLRAIESS